jgi:hypothetical protein
LRPAFVVGPSTGASPAVDEDAAAAVALLERVVEALERLAETTAAISAKLDQANERLERLNRSQWS